MKTLSRKIILLCIAGMLLFASIFGCYSYVNASAADGNLLYVEICASADEGGSSSGSSNFGGHAFVVFTNVTDTWITVGKMNVAKNQCLTLGTWGNQSSHIGIWYNLEAYLIKNKNYFSDRVSIGQYVTQNELLKINAYISSKDSWAPLSNCSTFAAGLWNSFSNITLSCGFINTPANLKSSIKQYNYTVGCTLAPYNSIVGYYDESVGGFRMVNPAAQNFAMYETSFSLEDIEALEVMRQEAMR